MKIKNVESFVSIESRLDKVGSSRLPYFKSAFRSRILFYFILLVLTIFFSIFVMYEIFFISCFLLCIVTILACILKILLIQKVFLFYISASGEVNKPVEC